MKTTPEEVLAKVEATTTPFRVQALRVLSMIGLLAASIGTADMTGIITLLPEEWGPWLISAGLFAASIKQGVLWIGDLLDNGKQDGSFKIGLWLMLVAVSVLLLSSCGMQVTADGCLLGKVTRGSNTYYAGPCVGPDKDQDGDADVDRFRVKWQSADGTLLRATYWVGAVRATLVEYQLEDGLWVGWSAKSGVVIGPLPEEVEKALEGNPVPTPTPTPASPFAVTTSGSLTTNTSTL